MKKLLILADKPGEKIKTFYDGLIGGLAEEGHVSLAFYEDLTLDIKANNVEVTIDSLGCSLRNFDMVYFRRTGRIFLTLACNLAICLNHWHIPFPDPALGKLGVTGTKLTSYLQLSLAGLPVIPIYYCWHTKIIEKSEEIFTKFGLPLIAKGLDGHRGESVFLIRKKEDLKSLVDKDPKKCYFFQKFLSSDEEYRVLVMGDKPGAFERKIRTDPKEFRSNAALGAKEVFMDVGEIPPKMREIALKAAKTLNLDIAGVDLIVDKQNEIWLLEANRGPGITYFKDQVSPELAAFISFFKEELNQK